MNKGLKFGLIFTGIYVVLFFIVLGLFEVTSSLLLFGLLYFFMIPFKLIWNSNLAYVLNAILYFAVGYGIGFLLKKKN
jgi:hypothetical protein